MRARAFAMHDADLLAGVSGDSGLLLLSVRLARTAWILFTLAILLASDLPYVSVVAVREIGHYGKLVSERGPPKPGRVAALMKFLDRFSLPARPVWTAFYFVASLLNLVSLLNLASPPLALFLLQAHLVRRLLETRILTRFSPTRREHPLGQAVGLVFYMLLSPSIAIEWALLDPAHPTLPVAVAGTGIFLLGMAVQNAAHRELASLRPAGGQGGYKVPTSWLFRNVSVCPHYTAELTIYLGLALLVSGIQSLWFALIFSAGNLSVTARRSLRWYKGWEGAGELAPYAIIPFIL